MKNLFAYGTLMCNDIMMEISGLSLSSIPAILKGYTRYSLKDEYYPALLPDENGQVEGLIYKNVPGYAWNRLDKFEGEMYIREDVIVGIENKIFFPAITYVIKSEYITYLTQSEWDFSDFLINGKSKFKLQYNKNLTYRT